MTFDPEVWAAKARETREMPNYFVPNPPPSPEDALIDELRAVLAPQLDDHFERWNDEHKAMQCLFCGGTFVGEPEDYHRTDCPVLCKDELLGRVAPTVTTA